MSDCGVGQIDFVNCLPITTVLQREKPDRLRLVMGNPGELNKQYRETLLDLGAMSSHYFLEDGGFELFPDISISSKGAVGSVLFFSKRPPAQLSQPKIAVPLASASSVRLLQILLIESYSLEPELFPVAEPEKAAGVDGFLLFGDGALTFDDQLTKGGPGVELTRMDLGQWWFETYRLPMVFGVWAARKTWIANNPQDFASLSQYLTGSRERWFGEGFKIVLAEAAKRTGLSQERLAHYYQNQLDYDLTDEHRRGLELYNNLCNKHGLV